MITFEKLKQVKEMMTKLFFLMDYGYFNKYYKIIVMFLSKQQELDADGKAIQEINFTGNLDRGVGAKNFFIIEEAKETILDFSQDTVKAF